MFKTTKRTYKPDKRTKKGNARTAAQKKADRKKKK